MDKDLKSLFDKVDLILMQNKSILEILHGMEKKPASTCIDKNSTEYTNKKQVYLNKLNNQEIKEPKNSTLKFYNVDYDEETGDS